MTRSRRELQAMADMITVETYGQMPRDQAGQVLPTPLPGVVVAEAARGTGRLEGHICEARHFYVPATPGRADARWESAEAGCSHLAINVAVFASVDEAEAAVERDAL